MSRKTFYVAISDQGRRIGEGHHNATITDAAVDLMRELHEDYGLTMYAVAKELGYPRSTVAKICNYERRADTPARYKRVTVYES